MIVYIYNIGVDLYNGFNGLRHRINWTYFTVLDGLAHPLYSLEYFDEMTLDIELNMTFEVIFYILPVKDVDYIRQKIIEMKKEAN